MQLSLNNVFFLFYFKADVIIDAIYLKCKQFPEFTELDFRRIALHLVKVVLYSQTFKMSKPTTN